MTPTHRARRIRLDDIRERLARHQCREEDVRYLLAEADRLIEIFAHGSLYDLMLEAEGTRIVGG